MSARKIVEDAGMFSVVGVDGYILEVFEEKSSAEAYLVEFEASTPKTAGDHEDLARKHNALFRNA